MQVTIGTRYNPSFLGIIDAACGPDPDSPPPPSLDRRTRAVYTLYSRLNPFLQATNCTFLIVQTFPFFQADAERWGLGLRAHGRAA